VVVEIRCPGLHGEFGVENEGMRRMVRQGSGYPEREKQGAWAVW
jgi:hypothetical protein